jgi:hypothetical protein
METGPEGSRARKNSRRSRTLAIHGNVWWQAHLSASDGDVIDPHVGAWDCS